MSNQYPLLHTKPIENPSGTGAIFGGIVGAGIFITIGKAMNGSGTIATYINGKESRIAIAGAIGAVIGYMLWPSNDDNNVIRVNPSLG